MARLILTKGDDVLREIALMKERVTIGRGPHNDIVINSSAISVEHAVIVTKDGDSFLEDTNSTNGTNVNGQPISKHFLQEGDSIELAQFRVIYSTGEADNIEAQCTKHWQVAGIPLIKILNGTNKGKNVRLLKPLTTLGKPQSQVALIAKTGLGYALSHAEGHQRPFVNQREIGCEPYLLQDGDIIDVAGIQLLFSLS